MVKAVAWVIALDWLFFINKLNSYLELVTVNSPKLKNRLVIDAPVVNAASENAVTALLRKHVIDISDVVLVFTDLFEVEQSLVSETIQDIIKQQDSNKFIFVVDHSEIAIDNLKAQEIAASWQRRLAEFGIYTGQFVVLSQHGDMSLIDQRLQNLNNDRSYRILGALEKSIRDIDDEEANRNCPRTHHPLRFQPATYRQNQHR